MSSQSLIKKNKFNNKVMNKYKKRNNLILISLSNLYQPLLISMFRIKIRTK